MNNETRSNTLKIVGAVLGLAVIGAALAWAFGSTKSPDTTDTATTTPEGATTTGPATVPGTPATSTTPAQPSSTYKDGTYSANGAYVSPAGGETVTIGVTLKGDTIVDATFQGNATNPTSKQMQARVAAGYRQYVVGKDIDSVSLTIVNGSSLAPKGFMDALTKIKAEAKA